VRSDWVFWSCKRINPSNSGICFQSNYSILRLEIPDNPSKPCLSCTKQWCLNQNLPICAGASLGDTNPDTATGKEGDVEARCFRAFPNHVLKVWIVSDCSLERDSPRDQIVVTVFLLMVFGLLLTAGVKSRMQKAGLDTAFNWSNSRRWWEVRNFIPAFKILMPDFAKRLGCPVGFPKISHSVDGVVVQLTIIRVGRTLITKMSMFLSPRQLAPLEARLFYPL
jgi:hypothetical protein